MIRNKLAAVAAALTLGVGGAVLGAAPAQAANTYPQLWICNSYRSVGAIKIIDTVVPTAGGYLGGGAQTECGLFNNTDNRIRIDPDPELGPDVDSTWWAYQWQSGYPYCDPGEGLIDPPNYYTDKIYYNTDKSGC